MTEQVIDIRDRIEKMRTQMTGSPTGLKQKENIQYVNEKNAFQNKSILKKSEVPTKSNLPMNGASNDLDQKIQSFEKKSAKSEKKEDKPFPQFNLNVSNPISWKLMLLIMLMQLLTNIMLVVVLYLK